MKIQLSPFELSSNINKFGHKYFIESVNYFGAVTLILDSQYSAKI